MQENTTASKGRFARFTALMKRHKIITGIAAIVLLFIGYKIYKAAAAGSTAPTYTLAIAHSGNIVQTVTGSGQVSAENQLDVTSQVSGAVKSINVSVGDHVTAGQLLATIDSHDAAIALQNAQISYAKFVAPPKTADLSSAQNNLTKAYNDAFSGVASAFTDLPAVMAGLNSLFYSQGGFLSEAYSTRLNSTSRPMRMDAGAKFDIAAKQYVAALQEYQGLTRNSATSSIDKLISDTYSMLKSISDALQQTQTTVNYIAVNETDYYASAAVTANNNINAWTNTVNSDLASVLSAQNSISSSGNSLDTLVTGADPLDLEAQQLSLQQAQETYAKYFVRAPFDGIVGRLPVSVYAQAGASTVMATIVGDQKIATISLNEVDAAKVAPGQPVSITFDAIDGLTATGTVKQVDLVGTVSQGVVSYSVKIAINTSDPRIKPGMSLNTTITTKEVDGVLMVPSAAVKTIGSSSYVQVLDQSAIAARAGSTTAGQYRNFRSASSTASTTGKAFTGAFPGISPSLTVTTAAVPQRVTVVTGASDDTNIEIVSGLTAGQAVVTKTSAGGASGAGAPSILSGLGGNRAGAAGARPAGGAPVRATRVGFGG